MNPTTPAATPPTENNACSALIASHNKGRVARELNETFSDLILGVRKHGKGGSVTLTVSVKPASGTDTRLLETTITVASKTPASAPVSQLYFSTEDGRLSKTDPEQDELPGIRAVESAPTVTLAAAAPVAVQA